MEKEQIFFLGELFEKVQLQRLFSDGKSFVDAQPLQPLDEIRRIYVDQSAQPDFELATFVRQHFRQPAKLKDHKSDPSIPLTDHINTLWDVLTRPPGNTDDSSSLIPLSFPYIVPGGRFREIYYWDSYFTMLGLARSGRADLIESMIRNFASLIDRFGYIPNGNRSYFLGRSQPPFFACMVSLLAELKGSAILAEYLPALLKEHAFWMRDAGKLTEEFTAIKRVVLMSRGRILNRYWDEHDTPRPESYAEDIALAEESGINGKKLFRNLRAACESGWDFSSRWLRDPADLATIYTTDIIPVDLNCLLYFLEKTIYDAYQVIGESDQVDKFFVLSNARKDAIDQYCWSKKKQFYYDFDFVSGRQTPAETLAACFPLFFKLASNEKANGVSNKLEKSFLKEGGFVTTTEITGQQWDAPNGWAPLQWIAIRGLLNYHLRELAHDAATRWMKVIEQVYDKTGKLMEKYDVVHPEKKAGGGEYPSQDGFGWTNGVYLQLRKELK